MVKCVLGSGLNGNPEPDVAIFEFEDRTSQTMDNLWKVIRKHWDLSPEVQSTLECTYSDGTDRMKLETDLAVRLAMKTPPYRIEITKANSMQKRASVSSCLSKDELVKQLRLLGTDFQTYAVALEKRGFIEKTVLTEENRALLFALVPKEHQSELEEMLFSNDAHERLKHTDSSDYISYLDSEFGRPTRQTSGSGDWCYITPETDNDADRVKKPSRRQSIDPREAVEEAWDIVHAELMSHAPDSTRIDREAFRSFCLQELLPKGMAHSTAYEKYIAALFDTATCLVLPAKQTELGRHCFGYAALLAGEFHFNNNNSPADRLCLLSSAERPDDRVASARADVDLDWGAVSKDKNEQRVSLSQFCTYFLKKYESRLVPETTKHFETFLKSNFQSALAMMLPHKTKTLDEHCFRYAALIAGEFYFDAAKHAETGCGDSGAVADILNIAMSLADILNIGRGDLTVITDDLNLLPKELPCQSNEAFFDDDASSDGEDHAEDGLRSEHARESDLSTNASFFIEQNEDLSRALELAGSGMRNSSGDDFVDPLPSGNDTSTKQKNAQNQNNAGANVHLSVLAAALKESEKAPPQDSQVQSLGGIDDRDDDGKRTFPVPVPPPAPLPVEEVSPDTQIRRRLSEHEISELEAMSPSKLQDFLVSECGVDHKFLQKEVEFDSQEIVAFAQTMKYDLRPLLGLSSGSSSSTSPRKNSLPPPAQKYPMTYENSPMTKQKQPRKKSLPHNPLTRQTKGSTTPPPETSKQGSPHMPPPKAVIIGGKNWDMDSGYDATEWQKALEDRNKSGIIMKKAKSGILNKVFFFVLSLSLSLSLSHSPSPTQGCVPLSTVFPIVSGLTLH